MAVELGVKSSTLSIAMTTSFISYGIGQLISGYFGDKVNPKILVIIGLLTTSFANFLISFVDNTFAIIVILTINGFAQSLLWPPLVKIMTVRLDEFLYKKCCALVTASASVSTIVIYLIAPICVSNFNYRLLFILSGSLAIITTIVWCICLKTNHSYSNDNNTQAQQSTEKISIMQTISKVGLAPILLVIIIQGLLRDGITTWTPTFINQTFDVSTSMSILTTVVLPVFSVISILSTRYINTKITNDMKLSTIIWGVAGVTGIVLLFGINSMFISVLALAILTACMHSTNLLLIGNLPIKFVKYGNVAYFSGLLNSCTYIGSSLSAYGIAKLSEMFGWNVTIIIWVALIFVAGSICASKIKRYSTW